MLFDDGVVFGRYSLPTDDLAGTYATIAASAEDAEYPATNLAALSNTGHLNLPSRPAKLTTTDGYWELTFGAPITVQTVALLYHNLDAGLDVTIECVDAPFSQALTIPSRTDDGWTVSPWVTFDDPVTGSVWRLSVNGTNSLPPSIGRLWLTNNLRDLGRDVQWGVEEIEEFRFIEQQTELGIGTFYDLGGKERAFSGQIGLTDAQSSVLIDMFRSARARVLPWLLIPDPQVNDAWIVRFDENRWSRTFEVPDHNAFPFRVRELSRGLPWP